MELMRSSDGNAIGINVNILGFNALLRVLRRLPGLRVEKARQNFLSDDAYAVFHYQGVRFEVTTPFSDCWIDRPDGCPEVTFAAIAAYLEEYRVRWWEKWF